MDERLRLMCQELRNMTSSQAADWLIETYPVDNSRYGEAIRLISHRSWKRTDQVRLAKHYFKKIPFAHAEPYEIFASFMSFKLFVEIIEGYLPIEKEKNSLLLYHLLPVLKKAAKTDSDNELAKSLIAKLDSDEVGCYMIWYSKESEGAD